MSPWIGDRLLRAFGEGGRRTIVQGSAVVPAFWSLTLVAAAFLALPQHLPAQDTAGVGTIRGRVTGAAGDAINDVAVCVPQTAQCVVTAADGSFVLAVRPGAYALEIAAPGGPLVVSENVQVRAGVARPVENVAGYSWDRRANALRRLDQLGLFPILGIEWPL